MYVTDRVFSTSIYGPSVKHEGHELKRKKQCVVTSSTDRENEVSKIFIISLGNWIELESTPRSQAVRALKYGPLNQPITAHLVPSRDIINRCSEISAILCRYHKVSPRL